MDHYIFVDSDVDLLKVNKLIKDERASNYSNGG